MIVTPTLKYSLAKGILESRIMLTRAGIGANPDNGRRSPAMKEYATGNQ